MSRLTRLLGLVVLIVAISACSNRAETIQYEGDPTIKATLKVMSDSSKENFMSNVGELFNQKYPNVEFEVVLFNSENYMEVADREKPDVMVVSKGQYEQFIEEGQLSDIDTLLSDDRFHVEGIVPEMLNYLRDVGKGKLYGIPARFTSKGLYYNKDLFDKYGVPYPEDQMTWEEVFQLAARFPSEDGVYGFYSRSFPDLVDDIALSRGLAGINAKDMRMNVGSESYREVFQMIMDAYNSNSVTLPDIPFTELYDPFITGTSAMTVDFNNYINRLYGLKEKQGEQFDLNWDIVTAPVAQNKRTISRDISPYMLVAGIHVINKDSTQKQAAWEFVKFATGEQLAKASSRKSSLFFPVRIDYIYNPEGKRMESFYKLKPEVNFIGNYDLLPDGVFIKVKDIITSEGKAAMVGAKTLDEAISSMQERGQQVLDQNPRK
ncbi:multiple sugar transport system substrate-binding protein [Fontibacillus panacisegetis]|uniref:Multiple sugar transport system substrate-binding protein n=1 Tax=Fontibacillus panacisegetis TaxID=670482 RepID=A0A1G7PPQ8_9BACL|nr:extracellular solute-binding protein [Fontibacillus panacisegetis]SDF88267.1 multiple sugar transport system substrate-binding protein [Fontibacillus panacisegetis]